MIVVRVNGTRRERGAYRRGAARHENQKEEITSWLRSIPPADGS